ncbi:hypothetical protein HYDPIDRAFT_25055, partial [Hydnomerulius pinastri MD-312]
MENKYPPRLPSTQKAGKEQAFVDMLNLIRVGKLDDEAEATFRKLARPLQYNDGIVPTQLYTIRTDVDRANEYRLSELPGQGFPYKTIDARGHDSNGHPVSQKQMETLLRRRLVAPRVIHLKVGAQVMLIKNIVQGQLVNGSVGQVVGFSTFQEAMQANIEIGIEEGLRGPRLDAARRAEALPDDARWPVVRFTNGRELLCIPTDFTVYNANGEMEARRRQ